MILWLGLFFDFLPCLNYLWPILSHFQFCWTYNLHLLLPPLIRVALSITGQAHRLSVNSKSHDYLLNPKFLPEEQPGHDPIKNSRFFIGQKQSLDLFWQFYCSNPAKRSYAEMFFTGSGPGWCKKWPHFGGERKKDKLIDGQIERWTSRQVDK